MDAIATRGLFLMHMSVSDCQACDAFRSEEQCYSSTYG